VDADYQTGGLHPARPLMLRQIFSSSDGTVGLSYKEICTLLPGNTNLLLVSQKICSSS
jgi:hypothetical protein